MRGSHLLEDGRGDVEICFSMDAIRQSREVAWRAFMRGEISPDPAFGGGVDEWAGEIQFSAAAGAVSSYRPSVLGSPRRRSLR
jgi:hypothetical protein